MKKICVLIIILMCCGCNTQKEINNNVIIPKDENKPIIEDLYHDDNPVKVSLYVDNAVGGLTKVNEIKETWQRKRDIVVLGSVYSQLEELESDYFQNIWKNAASKYENYELYKTGWRLEFSLDDGTVIDRLIDSPDDVEDFYNYLEIYLYDSANAQIGVWYSHLTLNDINEKTILTSMKLTAGSEFEKIVSPIKVTVFTYDGKDDFNPEGYYRGNSISTINIYNE